MRSLRKFRVNLHRRTPPTLAFSFRVTRRVSPCPSPACLAKPLSPSVRLDPFSDQTVALPPPLEYPGLPLTLALAVGNLQTRLPAFI